MTHRFCPRCGLSLGDAAAAVCERCGLVFAAADPDRAGFDGTSGLPLAAPPALRCWHCGEPVGRDARLCPSCGTDLTRRDSAAVRFEVAARHPASSAAGTNGSTVGPSAADAVLEGWGDADAGPPRGYVGRHWHGELPLGVSVWVNVFLVSFALNVVLLLAQRPIVWSDSGLLLLVVGVAIWLLRVGVAAWQVVGVWRSAGASIRLRRRQKRTFVWAFVARVWIVLLAVGWTIAFAAVGFVSIRENISIAFGDDPVIPPYTLAVVPDGTGVVITGGIRFGIAGDLAAALDANPEIRTVYLASEGGRMAPGGALFRLIRDHGLDTYALGPCYSACTIAFAGGLDRRVGRNGELGFHAPSFAGEPSSGLEQSILIDYLQPYREAGFSEAIIIRTRNTSPDDMWFPPDATLLGGNVLTAPRDAVARPGDVPVAMYLASIAQILAAYLPLPLGDGLSIAGIEAEGDRLTLVTILDRGVRVPPGVHAPVSPTVCAMAGASTGATYVFIARYPDGAEIARTEFDSAACAALAPN
ncbi:MAG: zinc ribbon domain-containing protein [Bauldia sp.]